MARIAIASLLTVLLAGLGGCGGHALYRNEPAFEYRVAGLKKVDFERLADGQFPSRPVTLNSQTYTSLSGDGIVIDSPSGAALGVVESAHGSLNVPRNPDGPVVVAAAGDGSVRVTLPPSVYSVGLWVYGRESHGQADGGAVKVVYASGAKEETITVPPMDPHRPAPAFVGIVSFDPITSLTWLPPVAAGPSSGTGIAGLTIETRH